MTRMAYIVAGAAFLLMIPTSADAGDRKRHGYYRDYYGYNEGWRSYRGDRGYRRYGNYKRYRGYRGYYRPRSVYAYGYPAPYYNYPAYGYGGYYTGYYSGYYPRYSRYYGRRYYRYRDCDGGGAGALIGGVAGALIGREIDRSNGRYYRRYYRDDGTTGAIVGGALGAAVGYGVARDC